ncbi:MAG: Cof-type HAD-IIB family hydrolase [Lachnospiraceae bacterium]|nr:Cof-type HAD-IIB family hydrolase [Lachnospiraceae bacterium]
MIDLHTHSTFSDGTFTPAELITEAEKTGLSAIAITDHDSISGISEAVEAAKDLLRCHVCSDSDAEIVSQKLCEENGAPTSLSGTQAGSCSQKKAGPLPTPEVVPGIELSTFYTAPSCKKTEVHIVGLYPDYRNPDFKTLLNDLSAQREQRNKTMCERLAADGYAIDYERLRRENPRTVITRANIARALLEAGYIKEIREAFSKLIGDNCPYYVPRHLIDAKEAVKVILRYHGIPVLAHPLLYHLSSRELREMVGNLKSAGLMAIEAQYSTFSAFDTQQIRALAEENGLLCSGGSDFHGANKPKIHLGTGFGTLQIEDSVLQNLKHALHGTTDSTRLFFFDFDGTLGTSSKEISPRTREALDQFVQSGGRFVFSSGRALSDVQGMMSALNLHYPHMYISAYNGGALYDCDRQMILDRSSVSIEDVQKIFAMAEKDGVYVHTYDDTKSLVLAAHDTKELHHYLSFNHMASLISDDVPGLLPEAPCKCLAMDIDHPERLKAFSARIEKEFNGRITTVLSQPTYLEIIPSYVDKGYGLRWLSRYLGVRKDRTLAAGDAMNDIPMLEAAGCGIAMCNAMREDVKKAADIVTKEDNDHDGLVPFILEACR